MRKEVRLFPLLLIVSFFPHYVPHLGEWVNNQRRSKRIYDAGKKCGLTVERGLINSTLSGLSGACALEMGRRALVGGDGDKK